nr:hypothetical protein [Microbacterium bovistercoris]
MRARTVIAVVAAVVVLGTAAGGAWLLLRPPSIEDAAHDYLRALQTGDIRTIEAMTAGSTLSDADRATMEDAFAGASGHISAPRIEGISANDGSVRATAQLAGEPVTILFMLGRAGRTYQLTGDFLATLTVDPTLGDAVRVGRAPVPARAAASLLPAEYPIAALPDGVLTGAQTVAVTNEKPVSVALDVAWAPDAATVAQSRLNAYEDRCAAAADAVPAHCGLRVPWAADLTTLERIAYRIETRPTLKLDAAAGTFAATGGVIVATAHGTDADGHSAAFTYRADEWALRGEIVFDGAAMQLAVR